MHPSRTYPATIVVPLLRQQDAWLQTCIESALQQSVACDLVIVTHPATPRGNLEVLARLDPGDGRMRVLCRPPGVRFAGALNFGIGAAACERVGFVLSDDWLHPHAVEACLAHDQDIVSTQAHAYTAEQHRAPAGTAPDRIRTAAAYAECRDDEGRARLLGHFMLLSRAAVQRAGGVDETVGDSPGVDDYHLLWTMLEHGASAAVVERPLYCYRDHGGERLTNRRPIEMWETMRRILVAHHLEGDALEERLLWHTRWFGGPLSQTTGIAAQRRRWVLAPEALARAAETLDERVGCARWAISAATLELHARRIARRCAQPISAVLAALTEAAVVGVLVPAHEPQRMPG